MPTGKAIIVSAPSGAGKTTIVRHLLRLPLNLAFSVSACSRTMRPNEQEGRDYYFMGVDGFRQKIKEDAFVEWEEVYKDHYYGTLKSELERIWQEGKHVIFDVDVIGGINLKKELGNRALSVFVQPPSIEALEERLRARESDSETMIRERVAKAAEEMKQAPKFDVILVNDNLDNALEEAGQIAEKFLNA